MSKKLIFLPIFVLLVIAGTVEANHAWGKYHWNLSTERTISNPLKLGDNLTLPSWDDSLALASSDWNYSVLKNEVAPGAGNSNCGPTSGRVEVCNGTYGDNGWLGIASIWITRGKENHITQAVVKLNDTYFNTSTYNSTAWRNFVMCQEVGHTFGLDHQDENFYNTNLGTCMDYTNNPSRDDGDGDNQHPNQHDYDMLTEIYAHLNSTDGDGSGGGSGNGKGNGKGKPSSVGASIDLNNPSSWGTAVRQDAQGKSSLFVRHLDNGQTLITHVLWTR